MKKRCVTVPAVALVLAVLLTTNGCSTMMRGMMKNRMFEHYDSPLPVESAYRELVERFDRADHWTLIDTQNNAEIYGDYGELRPFREIHVCSPATAVRIMQNDETSYMAAMIPLQIAVYESASVGTSIAVMNTEMMSRMFTDNTVKYEILAARDELLEIISAVTQVD